MRWEAEGGERRRERSWREREEESQVILAATISRRKLRGKVIQSGYMGEGGVETGSLYLVLAVPVFAI